MAEFVDEVVVVVEEAGVVIGIVTETGKCIAREVKGKGSEENEDGDEGEEEGGAWSSSHGFQKANASKTPKYCG